MDPGGPARNKRYSHRDYSPYSRRPQNALSYPPTTSPPFRPASILIAAARRKSQTTEGSPETIHAAHTNVPPQFSSFSPTQRSHDALATPTYTSIGPPATFSDRGWQPLRHARNVPTTAPSPHERLPLPSSFIRSARPRPQPQQTPHRLASLVPSGDNIRTAEDRHLADLFARYGLPRLPPGVPPPKLPAPISADEWKTRLDLPESITMKLCPLDFSDQELGTSGSYSSKPSEPQARSTVKPEANTLDQSLMSSDCSAAQRFAAISPNIRCATLAEPHAESVPTSVKPNTAGLSKSHEVRKPRNATVETDLLAIVDQAIRTQEEQERS